MHKPIILLSIGAVVIAGAIIYAFIAGGLWDEARTLFGYPWFHVAMIDLYLGFFLIAGWIAFREKSLGKTVLWIFLLCTLGNLISCIYAIQALMRSEGDWRQFWMGRRA